MVVTNASETCSHNELLKPLKQAGLSKGLVDPRNIHDQSFKKKLDRMRIWSKNSENIGFGNSVPDCVETTWSTDSVEYNLQRKITSNYCSNNSQVVSLANHLIPVPESDARSKFLEVTPSVPLATDQVVDGHEEDVTEQYIDQGQKEAPKRRKMIIRSRSPNISRVTTEESYASLKAKIKALKEENRRLRSKLQEEAEISLQIKNENTILLDNLRQKWPTDVIASLEAENPDREVPR